MARTPTTARPSTTPRKSTSKTADGARHHEKHVHILDVSLSARLHAVRTKHTSLSTHSVVKTYYDLGSTGWR